MILVSLNNGVDETPLINPTYPTFKTKRDTTANHWPQYNDSLYNSFKAHWINGVNMYDKYGSHELANNSSTVCATSEAYDFDKLLAKFDTLPSNTIIFGSMIRDEYNDGPTPADNIFVANYSSFMKLVSVWKWIDSYKNEPHILEHDTTRELLLRTMWQKNINWTTLEDLDG